MVPRLNSASRRAVLLFGACVLLFTARCSTPEELESGSSDPPLTTSGGAGGGGAASGGAAPSGGASSGGVSPTSGGTPSTGGVSTSGGAGGAGTGGVGTGGVGTGGAPPTGGTAGAGGASGGAGGSTGGAGGATGGTGGGTGGAPPATFVYKSIPGSKCRDNSEAGYFIKQVASSKNLMIFLEGGGGVCFDGFLCNLTPENVRESAPNSQSIGDLAPGPVAVPQSPPTEGIFKNDSRNPVRDWSMIYIPYCTGDVHAGTRENASIPQLPPQQFVGYTNFGLFLNDFKGAFPSVEKVLLAGTSGGSYGALINADRTIAALPASSTLYVVADSGVPFDDQFLEPCLQTKWRNLWGLNGAFPADCAGCRNADGGGIARGLGKYLYDKYTGRVLGGFVSSMQDQVVKAFYWKGYNNCSENPLDIYPADRFPNGLRNLRDSLTDKARTSSYFMAGDLHTHLYRARFYENNGLNTSIATWLDSTLKGQSVHVGN